MRSVRVFTNVGWRPVALPAKAWAGSLYVVRGQSVKFCPCHAVVAMPPSLH